MVLGISREGATYGRLSHGWNLEGQLRGAGAWSIEYSVWNRTPNWRFQTVTMKIFNIWTAGCACMGKKLTVS